MSYQPQGFTPNGNYATLSATSTSSNVALPASSSAIVVYNTGKTDSYINLGSSNAVSATTANIPVKANSWVSVNVGANTYLAGITSNGSTTLSVVGGIGQATGTATGAISSATLDSLNNLNINVAGQTFYPSTNNSVSQTLTTGSTWTGTIESVIQQPGLWLTVTSNVAVTVSVMQYKDSSGTIADVPTQVYPVLAGVPFALARDIKGNYLNISVSNSSGSSSTLTVDTYYGQIDNSNCAEGLIIANQTASIVTPNTAVQLPNFTLLQGGNVRASQLNNIAGAYIGQLGVTSSNGFELAPGESYPIPSGNTGLWYVVSATAGDKFMITGA